MFICPNCRRRLVRTPNPLGIHWVCEGCHGRVVSMTILRKAMHSDYMNRLWSAARNSKAAASRQCPTCNNRMLEVSVSSESSLRLDVCQICQFVWFDPKEYESAPTLPAALRKPEEKQLPQRARELIAVYQVQQMAERQRDESPDEPWKYLPAMFGMPIESERVAFKNIPWLTWATAALILLASLWAFSDLEEAVRRFGFLPAEPWRYAGLTLLTSFFLHGGLFHLLSNLYFLLVFGDNVEDYLGRRRWLALLLLSIIVGHLSHLAGEPRSQIPCIGASGGISGLITYYALQFPHAKLGLISPLYWWFRWIQVPAWVALVLWLLLQLVGAAEQLSGFSNVSALAHLGGAAVGFLFWLRLRQK